MPKLYVVTATIDPEKTHHLWKSWRENATFDDWEGHVLVNSQQENQPAHSVLGDLERLTSPGRLSRTLEVVGVVPAFHAVVASLPANDDIIALLHDDVRIDEHGWDEKLMWWFERHPECVLAGFGGAYGVGAAGMYRCPAHGGPAYVADSFPWVGDICGSMNGGRSCDELIRFDPMTLARHHFMSNMENAEAHGERVTTPRPVAVLDGFSMIGRAWFVKEALRLLRSRDVVHHAYDVAFGALAKRHGKQTWLLPFQVHHHGGMSAVANTQYQEWAQREKGGDQGIWLHAHRQVWEEFRDVLPFDVRRG